MPGDGIAGHRGESTENPDQLLRQAPFWRRVAAGAEKEKMAGALHRCDHRPARKAGITAGGCGCGAVAVSFISATAASVVRSVEATLTAFARACFVTLTGSIIPSFIIKHKKNLVFAKDTYSFEGYFELYHPITILIFNR